MPLRRFLSKEVILREGAGIFSEEKLNSATCLDIWTRLADGKPVHEYRLFNMKQLLDKSTVFEEAPCPTTHTIADP